MLYIFCKNSIPSFSNDVFFIKRKINSSFFIDSDNDFIYVSDPEKFTYSFTQIPFSEYDDLKLEQISVVEKAVSLYLEYHWIV